MDPAAGAGVACTDTGSGRVVVLLHGQPGDRHDWNRVVQALDGRARVVAPDRPGYGATGGEATGVAGNADAVVRLLDSLGVERATVAGYSWGGAVALELALRHRDRVDALALVASVGGEGSLDDLDRVLATPVVGPVVALAGLGMLWAPQARRMLVAAARAARLRLPAVDDLHQGPTTPWRDAWRSFTVEQRALVRELPSITARLSAVSVPAVVVIGETDRLVRAEAQHDLASRLPSARVVRVPSVGHLLLHQAPEVVARAILDVAGEGKLG